MSRYRAALLHLAISLTAFAAAAAVVRFLWYPGFFFTTDGGWAGLQLLLIALLVLGPLLTLIVYRTGKRGLGFDLTLIALLQAGTLAVGLYVIYSERPIFFVFYEKGFYSLSADSFTRFGMQPPDPRQFDHKGPAEVYVALPDNPIEEAGVRKVFYDDYVPIWAVGRYYQPLSRQRERLTMQGTAPSALRQRDDRNALARWLDRHGGSVDDYAFIPIYSRYNPSHLGVRTSDGTFVGLLDLPPAPPPIADPFED